ncbi:MAG: ABC transporter permease [Defluviitaleaceae bacterium]|nr:ABC transporter permease [Defluviitaleaceae bacterium]
MYILTNAIKNLTRNTGRNVLAAAVIFAVIAAAVAALIIYNTAGGVIADYKTRFGSQVVISVDIDKYVGSNPPRGGQSAMALPQVTAAQSISFADSNYIREYTMRVSKDVTGDDLKAIDEGSGGVFPMGGNTLGDFMLTNNFDDFESGMRYIKDGGPIMNSGECLISEEFADLNGLKTGDKIELFGSMSNAEDGTKRTATYSLTVAGIFYDFTDEYPGMRMPLSNKRNEILVSTETLTSSMLEGESGLAVSAVFYLKDPQMLADFEAEIRGKGLSDYMAVRTDEAGYNRIVAPVEGLMGFTLTFLIIILALGAAIIALLCSIAIRERKYEIGVLRAMGMKKKRVALGLWAELIMISCLCLCFGIAAGTLAAEPIGNTLLAEQTKAAQTPDVPRGPINLNNPRGTEADAIPPLEQLDIRVGTPVIMQIIGMTVCLVSFAGFVSIGKITKYEPIKILSERN